MGSHDDAEMYEDGGPDEQKPEDQADDKHEDDQSPVTTIPKSLLAGKDFAPGDEVVFQIVSLHENEAVIRYAPEKPKEGAEGEESAKPEMGESDAEMSSYMQ